MPSAEILGSSMKKFRIAIILAYLCYWPAHSETLTQQVVGDLGAPFTDAYSPLIMGSGATLYLYAFKYEIGDPLQRSWQERKPLGKFSKYGDAAGQWIPNILYAVGMGIHTWSTNDKKSRARAILMTKATVYSGVVSAGLKYVFREPRPNGSSDMASFPSGHATTAFAFASVVGAEHEWYYGLAAYSLATFVAASRINDNQHRLHDVVGGATIGLSYGLGLYYRQLPEDAQDGPRTVYQVLPSDRLDGFILTALHEF